MRGRLLSVVCAVAIAALSAAGVAAAKAPPTGAYECQIGGSFFGDLTIRGASSYAKDGSSGAYQAGAALARFTDGTQGYAVTFTRGPLKGMKGHWYLTTTANVYEIALKNPRDGFQSISCETSASAGGGSSAQATTTTASATGPGSSRANPIPIGQTYAIPAGSGSMSAGWTIKIVSVVPNATAQVLAGDSMNSPPVAGHQFFLANVVLSYAGSGSSNPANIIVESSTVGASNNAYPTSGESCGVIANQIDSGKTISGGGSITGVLCWNIASADASGLVLFFADTKTYWALH